jgi:hypothetical protein
MGSLVCLLSRFFHWDFRSQGQALITPIFCVIPVHSDLLLHSICCLVFDLCWSQIRAQEKPLVSHSLAAVVNLHFSTNLLFTHPAFSSSCSLPSQCPQQLSGFGFFAARGRAYRIILPAVFSAVFPSVLASPGIAQGIRSCARRSGARCLICFCRQGLPLLLLTLQFVFCYLGLARRSGARCLICFFRQDLPLLPLTLQFVFCYLGLHID